MKAMKATGAMRKMKAARKSKVARGRLAKSMVLRGVGGKEKTISGLRREDLMRNKRGRVVSKKMSSRGRISFKRISKWTAAIVAARKALAMTGFVAINGKTTHGKALYAKAKSLYTEASSS